MHTIIGFGNNGRATAAVLAHLKMDYKTYDVLASKSTLRNVEESEGLIHICTREQIVGEVIEKLNGAPNAKEIIIHSTMPVGQSRKMKAKTNLPLVYMPVFFKEAQPEVDAITPHRIIIGAEKMARTELINPYIAACVRAFDGQPYLLSYENAEIIKLATNSMRANMISFFNELYGIALEHGQGEEFKDVVLQSPLLTPTNVLDTWETETGWGRNPQLLGRPFGGFCLPKDTEYLGIKTTRAKIE